MVEPNPAEEKEQTHRHGVPACLDQQCALAIAIREQLEAEQTEAHAEDTRRGIAVAKAEGRYHGGRPSNLPPIETDCVFVEGEWRCKRCGKYFTLKKYLQHGSEHSHWHDIDDELRRVVAEHGGLYKGREYSPGELTIERGGLGAGV
jgi:hypothetical protein